MMIKSINPATEMLNKEFETLTFAQSLGACKSAKAAFPEWRDLNIDTRLGYLKKFAEVLRSRKQEYARLITIEMGKPIKDSLVEIDRSADLCDLYVANAKGWLQDEAVRTEFHKSFVAFEPVGLVLEVMPWNFPFSQVMRCALPSLALGNVTVLKHSNCVPMCALAIENVFRSAGLPDNVFKTIITDHAAIPKLIRSRFVDAVSLTGSFDAGRDVAKVAASSIKKCVLELGGSNPFVVLSDADIALAGKKAVETRMSSNGQSCSSSKRFIVVSEVAEEFTNKVVEATKALVVGDPLDPKTQIGPLANPQQLQKLEEQVRDAMAKGAKLLYGGSRIGQKGCFYQPTVLTGIKKNMKVAKEEVFGPVIPIMAVRGESEAIKLANNTDFGLGGSIWTRDVAKGEALARRIEAGTVCVNRGANSDSRMPFGGIKKSGIGREYSRYGLIEFANIKSVIVS